jgi:hypothetical protein
MRVQIAGNTSVRELAEKRFQLDSCEIHKEFEVLMQLGNLLNI